MYIDSLQGYLQLSIEKRGILFSSLVLEWESQIIAMTVNAVSQIILYACAGYFPQMRHIQYYESGAS